MLENLLTIIFFGLRLGFVAVQLLGLILVGKYLITRYKITSTHNTLVAEKKSANRPNLLRFAFFHPWW